MKDTCREKIAAAVRGFHLPRYEEIPDVGLYLEQTAKYISEYLSGIQENCITISMISNYVKKNLISRPEKKQYSREQIAYLIFIAKTKNVLSLDDLTYFIGIQKQTYPAQQAYDYFCAELENILLFVFGLKERLEEIGQDSTDEKLMLRSAVIAVSHKIYLEKCLTALRGEADGI